MQAIYRDAAIAFTPRLYFDHAPSRALNLGEIEQSRDVIYLVNNDLRLKKDITEILTAVGMKVVSFDTGY